MGYSRAGFEVVGVDCEPQPRYPFAFLEADALDLMRGLIAGSSVLGYYLSDFDAIHASPPCQAYSSLRSIPRFSGKEHPALVDDTRQLLAAAGLPWVMENVPGSNLDTHVILCGSMFGLGAYCDGQFHQLRRHRLFETSFYFLMPLRCHHVGRPVGVYGNGGSHRRIKDKPGINGFTGTAAERRSAMGIDWMGRYGLSQAVPPAYCEFIGKQLLAAIS